MGWLNRQKQIIILLTQQSPRAIKEQMGILLTELLILVLLGVVERSFQSFGTQRHHSEPWKETAFSTG